MENAERNVEDEIFGARQLDRAVGLLRAVANAQPAEHETHEVHQAVPAHVERERDGIYVRIGKQRGFRLACPKF